jgi:hypothetical protein
MMPPKTQQPKKNSFFNKIPFFGKKDKNNEITVSERIDDIAEVQENILKKMEEMHQYSGAFDYYHQRTPHSTTPNVLDQLYGRDLWFLRQYYTVCSPIDQLIFAKRFEQLRAVSDCVADNPKKIGWRVVHKKYDSPNFKVTKDMEKDCRWLEALIQSPNKIRHPGGFPDALIAMAESKMLFDRIPIEKLEHVQFRGTGKPASYLIPDAATIKPTTWVLYAMAGSSSGYTGLNKKEQAGYIINDSRQTANELLPNGSPVNEMAINNAAKQLARNKNSWGVASEAHRLRSGIIVWVQQMPDKQLSAGYTDKDLSVFIGNHSPQINTWGWSSGSAFERSFAFGEAIFKMTGYNLEIFDSRMPEGVLSIANAGIDKRGKQQLHERMQEEGTDRFNNILVEYVSDPDKDIKYMKMKDKPTDMQFDKMFMLYVKLKCAAYGFDYTELNLEDGRSGGMGGSGAHEKRMANQAATGIRSDTRYYAHCVTEGIIAPWTSEYKMEFIHDVEETKEEIDLRKEKMDYKSVYETRTEDNLEEEWWNDAPKEFQDDLKKYAHLYYLPSMQNTHIVQLITKQMDIDQQEKMQEQAEKEEAAAQAEEQPEEGIKESQEIADLRSALTGGEEPEKEMGKSIGFTVEHRYLN